MIINFFELLWILFRRFIIFIFFVWWLLESCSREIFCSCVVVLILMFIVFGGGRIRVVRMSWDFGLVCSILMCVVSFVVVWMVIVFYLRDGVGDGRCRM